MRCARPRRPQVDAADACTATWEPPAGKYMKTTKEGKKCAGAAATGCIPLGRLVVQRRQSAAALVRGRPPHNSRMKCRRLNGGRQRPPDETSAANPGAAAGGYSEAQSYSEPWLYASELQRVSSVQKGS